MAEHPINELMQTTLQKIKELVDSSTVVGDPIVCGTATIIPVSKIAYGFGSGGSDLPAKKEGEFFGGGGGAGASVTPLGFIVITETEIKLLQLDEHRDSAGKLIDLVPELIDKVRDGFGKKNSDAEAVDVPVEAENSAAALRSARNGVRVNQRGGNKGS